ncbi:MAG: hypothetical protein AB2L09_06705 [Coriobacteriia bacterium]
MDSGPNTVTFVSSDGYRMALPLSWVLEKGAILAYQVNGEALSASVSGSNQLWIPGAPAKYFTRDVVEIVLSHEEMVPPVPGEEQSGEDEYVNRPNVGVMKSGSGNMACKAGESVTFEGYADDYDRSIAAVEFSLDEGETWTRYPTSAAEAGKWVYWYFTYTPEVPGIYALKIRSVTEQGDVSPLASTVAFEVW